MANYSYACFISYKHPPSAAPRTHFYNEFVKAFQEPARRVPDEP